MACKNKCKKFVFVKKKRTAHTYFEGGRWCSICERWMSFIGLWCPCCGQQARTKPRNKHGSVIKMIIDSKRIK